MNAKQADGRPNLADLVRDLTGVGTTERADPVAAAPRIEPGAPRLALTDLLSDDNGEIVFFNDGGFRTLAIETSETVVSKGQTTTHRTAAGEDVSGFNYVTFESGLTLYFEEGLDLLLPGS